MQRSRIIRSTYWLRSHIRLYKQKVDINRNGHKLVSSAYRLRKHRSLKLSASWETWVVLWGAASVAMVQRTVSTTYNLSTYLQG
ncbi:jg15256 [Pararge aegeria aegeria]|uniref:Jg15256 protein n=1 Tax=Pararge aegeria aegeria TaxID=348720 RepID=A0A8S4SKE6_9NEOP|nr:jg15256 [Pararge aegeria aegeria]